MSPQLETFLRSVGVVIATALFAYFSDASHLTELVGPLPALVIASLAASGLAALDKKKSPDGTIAFGAVGKYR
jgi:hypothetical protein